MQFHRNLTLLDYLVYLVSKSPKKMNVKDRDVDKPF
jgi:hypothetical protein